MAPFESSTSPAGPSGQRVAIIGAGASGISAIKCCLDEGLLPVCFERTPAFGGLWRYTDIPVEGQGCVMKSTVINVSKEMMSYSDYPTPREFPVFMHNTQVLEYFKNYTEHFDLEKHIVYNTEVLWITKAENFPKYGQWKITTRDISSGEEKTDTFDYVIVCTGHHAEKHVPAFPGLEEFEGKVIHSHEYRKPQGFEDKRVLIVGIGNSGGDVAVELSRYSKQVFLSTRQGTWIFNRVSAMGLPLDMLLTTRFMTYLKDQFSFYLANMFVSWRLNKRIDHKLYSLQPRYGPLHQHPMVNDDMPNRIICGAVKVKTDVKRFTATGVEFVDGTAEDGIDVVVLATGYSFGFPFIDKEVIDVIDNEIDLYQNVFVPDLDRHTMAIIGCVQPFGAVCPVAEMQCRAAVRVFKVAVCPMAEMQCRTAIKVFKVAIWRQRGSFVDRLSPLSVSSVWSRVASGGDAVSTIGVQPFVAECPVVEMQSRAMSRVFTFQIMSTSKIDNNLDLYVGKFLTLKRKAFLPSAAEMRQAIRAQHAFNTQRYAPSRRHSIQVEIIPYMDQLAQLAGCSVQFGHLLLTDPLLAMKVFFGPFTPYQYRLYGPLVWSGAREAIQEQWKRTYAPLKTKTVPASQTRFWANVFRFVLIVTVVLFFRWPFALYLGVKQMVRKSFV
ncbi:hypothetical protein RRG08_033654 [Elysia crispata]|uniref:Flavin-containing monooxygenase n=1 Tax=Elysia crispata TaxID=231223 RepID=A0AAE1D165_9GAST|nr:hypothetical protein RRG08_033654 [Elysia crispata]